MPFSNSCGWLFNNPRESETKTQNCHILIGFHSYNNLLRVDHHATMSTPFTLQHFGHGTANLPCRDLHIKRWAERLNVQVWVPNFKMSAQFTLKICRAKNSGTRAKVSAVSYPKCQQCKWGLNKSDKIKTYCNLQPSYVTHNCHEFVFGRLFRWSRKFTQRNCVCYLSK